MNLIEFSQIISNPSGISKGQTHGLTEILDEYPYFQAARFLQLYALKKQRSFRYNDALKNTAAYTTDRELLFNYITSFDFDLGLKRSKRSQNRRQYKSEAKRSSNWVAPLNSRRMKATPSMNGSG